MVDTAARRRFVGGRGNACGSIQPTGATSARWRAVHLHAIDATSPLDPPRARRRLVRLRTYPVTRGEIGVLLRVIGEALVVEKGTLSPPEICGSPLQVWEDL